MATKSPRRVSVAVCSPQMEVYMAGFIKLLQSDKFSDVERVEFIQLPYNDLDSFKFETPVDVVMLVHSINDRRFAITNVKDALYDRFLTMAKEKIGREKVAVVVYDFKCPIIKDAKAERMASFRVRQPLTFTCSKLTLTCGKLCRDCPPEIDDDDRAGLKAFLENARHLAPKMPNIPKETGSGWFGWLVILIGVVTGLGALIVAALSCLFEFILYLFSSK